MSAAVGVQRRRTVGKAHTASPQTGRCAELTLENVRHKDKPSPASATIKEPGIDTKSVPGLFFFIPTFTPKRGVFSNFATHFDFRCHDVVLLPGLSIAVPLHIALLIR